MTGTCLRGRIYQVYIEQMNWELEVDKNSKCNNSILPPEYPKVFTDQPTPKVTFSDIPVTLRCPSCGLNTLTTLEYKNGLLTYLASGGICLIGGFFGCCLIPCCINGCKDVNHVCPHCRRAVGTYHRLGN
ncbi:unnamed protein product [Schistosoma margrebowiei]|uniref:LITAF domain-containing protein n=1 Tax=Schistosoma margrebowiei TaxID=48269 RepID=A0AA84Z9T9_9TREM|nr:unnamed protein product [Schistosoma margrebowiei]